MKPRLFVLVFIAALLLILGTLAAACGDDGNGGGGGEEEGITVDDLIGNWYQRAHGTALQLNADGTFFGAANLVALEEEQFGGFGEFLFDGTLITFMTSDDSRNCAGQIGTYEVQLREQEQDQLRLELDEDPCSVRARTLPRQAYSRASP